MCINGLYTRRYTHLLAHHIVYIWIVHQEVYTHFLIHMDEHTWLKYACTMQKPPNTHQHTQTSLYAKLIK